MPLETVNFIEDMNAAWPTGTDPVNEGDNHVRNVKNGILNSFPNTTGIWNTTNKITMGGADMTSNVVENVAAPVADGDAVNLATLTARAPGFLSWGVVSAAGSHANNPGSDDYSIIKGNVGRYDITFNRPVSGGQAQNFGMSVTCANNAGTVATVVGDANLVTVQVYLRSSNGNFIDELFHFIRMVA